MRRAVAALVAVALAPIAAEVSAQPAQPPAAADAPAHTIVPPKLVKFVEAEFPPSEAKAGKGATVVLQIAITATRQRSPT